METRSGPRVLLRTGLLLSVLLAVWSALFPETSSSICSQLSSAKLLSHVQFLSAPRLEGRGIGSAGLRQAGDYLANAFAACGLLPAGDDGTFFQKFPALGPPKLGSGNALVVETAKGKRALELGDDWSPLFFSANASVEGAAIFAGYGVADAEIGVDDYAGIDTTGKVILALRYEPGKGNSPGTRPGQLSLQSDLRFKAAAATDHGALALVVIAGPKDEDPELPSLGEGWAVGTSGLPVAILRREALAPALGQVGISLDDLLGQNQAQRPKAVVLHGLRVKLAVDLERGKVEQRNVLALKPGADSLAVVIGAHYDHLGRGGRQSLAAKKGAIHPGADDNASGTALLVEIACELARDEAPNRLNGTVLFAAFAGEETGLLGSTYYVKHPAVPLSETVAMLNMDMVGRLRSRRLVVFGTGTALEFPRFMARISRDLDVIITSHADGYGPSDHTPFFTAGLPVLHFFTGAHSDYHRPSDTWEKINAAGMVTVGRAVAEAARLILATGRPLSPGPPQPQPRSVGGGGYGAYLGIIPDFSRDRGGVLLAGVRSDSPAARAQLRKGDILTEVGGVKVEDLYDLTYALRSHKAGQLVKIKFVRAGRRHQTEATLGRR